MGMKLSDLNNCSVPGFVAVCGAAFEHSPWIAERTAARRPFRSRDELHSALCATVGAASADEQLALIRAHPDLVGRMARRANLTSESAREQSAAGLDDLTVEESRQLDEFNTAYRAKFGFPFVICARENKKHAILAAFPARLTNTPDREASTALAEIAKIARLRLFDAVEEG